MRKLRFALFLLVLNSGLWAAGLPQPNPDDWARFKQNFISADGRVIDWLQQDMSHSEGQGYALLLAVRANDKTLFDLLLQWTANNLQVRHDALHAWAWGKRPNNDWTVEDYNNATDGDILIAYALILANERWRQDDYRQKALAVLASLKKHLLIDINGRNFLLPGYYGFTGPGGARLNPSYQIFPAFQVFAEADDAALWHKIQNDAQFLLVLSQRNVIGLPADWLVIDASGAAVADQNPNRRFGNEAIRVILYCAWADLKQPEAIEKVLDYYEKNGRIPQWFGLDDEEVSEQNTFAGGYRIYALAAQQLGRKTLAERLKNEAKQRLQDEPQNYYSHVLYLLAGE